MPPSKSLRPYQTSALNFLAYRERGNLHAGMGLGKTATLLHLLHQLKQQRMGPSLVIAPLRVAKSVWPREPATWPELRNLKLLPILGDLHDRREALDKLDENSICTINYDNASWLVDHFGADWPFKNVVADESTRLKGFRLKQGTRRASSLSQIAHRQVKRWFNLTGTPSPNGLEDLWGQQWFVDGGASLGRSFSAFRQRWFHPITADRHTRWAPFAHSEREIVEAMRPSTFTVDAKDWFDLEEPIVSTIYVDLPFAARSHYRDLDRKFMLELEEGDITAANAAVKTSKLLQLANGAIYHEDHTWSWMHDEKIEAVRSVIEEAAGANVIVVYEFISDRERLKKAFPQAQVLKDTATEDAWNAGQLPVLLLHPRSAAHGLNLQHGGNIVVFMGQSWNLEERMQVIERIGPVRQKQSGYDRPVHVYNVIARGTMDEIVLARIGSKRSVMDSLQLQLHGRELA